MTAITIALISLGALGTIFFSGMRAALLVCDRLIFEFDIKNNSIKQGVVFRPYDNRELCVTLMHTGELVSECMLGIGLLGVGAMLGGCRLYVRILFMTALALASLMMFKTIPSALFARKANGALRRFSPLASTMSNFIYPWLYIVLFPIVARANKRGDDKFYELIPFYNNPDPASKSDYRGNDFKILLKALDFTNIKIRECLVPRNEIVYADISDSIDALVAKFADSGFSKILICDGSIDRVVGYVNAISMFHNPQSIDKIMTPVIDVPDTMTADQLFKLFIKRRLSVAIVVDEYGGTAGMLTVEDIIEEITGEIEDEHDSQELTERQVSANEYLFAGRLEIDYINDKYKINLPKTDEYETLAGYILKLNEDFPRKDDELRDGIFSIKIVQVTGPKIELVRIRVGEARGLQ